VADSGLVAWVDAVVELWLVGVPYSMYYVVVNVVTGATKNGAAAGGVASTTGCGHGNQLVQEQRDIHCKSKWSLRLGSFLPDFVRIRRILFLVPPCCH